MKAREHSTTSAGPRYFLLIVSAILPAIFFSQPANCRDVGLDGRQIGRRQAQHWIKLAMDQYRSGSFKDSEESLFRAREYEKHLTASERQKLSQILEKVRQGAVGKPPSPDATKQQSAPATGKPTERVEQAYRKETAVQSYIGAVVADAESKVQDHLRQGKFDKARQTIDTTEQVINEHKAHFDGAVLAQHSRRLEQLSEQIVRKEQAHRNQFWEQKHEPIGDEPPGGNTQTEAEKAKRITELLESAKASESKDRYYAALGQIESLLAIDGSNAEALAMKERLDGEIDTREQPHQQSDSDFQRFGGLENAQDATAPSGEVFADSQREQQRFSSKDAPFNRRLKGRVESFSGLTSNTSFGDAIEFLKNSSGEPPLNIVVMWRDLSENAGIDRNTPINVDPVSDVSLGTALEIVLDGVSGPDGQLGYVVKGGVIRIATKQSIAGKMETAVYNTTDLLSTPGPYGPGGATGGYGRGSNSGYGGDPYGGRSGNYRQNYGGYNQRRGSYNRDYNRPGYRGTDPYSPRGRDSGGSRYRSPSRRGRYYNGG